MTGELPVSLVHAARVLQVFVSVVSVGKHLPAPVTLVAFACIWKPKSAFNIVVNKTNKYRECRIGTFCEGKLACCVLSRVFQREWDPEELRVAVPVPHQELLAWTDLLADLVEDLTLDLNRHQVLLLWEASALHKRHPVSRRASAVHEVTQAAVLKHLREEARNEASKGSKVDKSNRWGSKLLPPTLECCRRMF